MKIQELVHKRLMHAQKTKKDQLNKYHREVEYSVGYKFFLSTKNLRLKLQRKFWDHNMGIFKVLKQVGPIAYKLDLSHSAALKTIHPSFLLQPSYGLCR